MPVWVLELKPQGKFSMIICLNVTFESLNHMKFMKRTVSIFPSSVSTGKIVQLQFGLFGTVLPLMLANH